MIKPMIKIACLLLLKIIMISSAFADDLKITDLAVRAPLFKSVNNEQLKKLKNRGVKLVDIRTPPEWMKTGIIKGSLLLPFRMPNGQVNQNFPLDFSRIVSPEEEVMLICRTGNRSRMAADILSSRFGYKHVYNVRHGITYWLREKNPTIAPNIDGFYKTK